MDEKYYSLFNLLKYYRIPSIIYGDSTLLIENSDLLHEYDGILLKEAGESEVKEALKIFKNAKILGGGFKKEIWEDEPQIFEEKVFRYLKEIEGDFIFTPEIPSNAAIKAQLLKRIIQKLRG